MWVKEADQDNLRDNTSVCVHACVSMSQTSSHQLFTLTHAAFYSVHTGAWLPAVGVEDPRMDINMERSLSVSGKFLKAFAYTVNSSTSLTSMKPIPKRAPWDFHICNSDSDHQVASFSAFYRLFSPSWKCTLYKQKQFFFSQSKLWNNEYWVITTLFEKFICL